FQLPKVIPAAAERDHYARCMSMCQSIQMLDYYETRDRPANQLCPMFPIKHLEARRRPGGVEFTSVSAVNIRTERTVRSSVAFPGATYRFDLHRLSQWSQYDRRDLGLCDLVVQLDGEGCFAISVADKTVGIEAGSRFEARVVGRSRCDEHDRSECSQVVVCDDNQS